ncbi:MAG: HlyD family efflux transporter periplasmic adaptor subunit, partial [Patescibacteria group bacterium]|nr:HlyD family efflux transporter periplasmic adaptor subunit [Patescibacteria group bacterium]
RSRRWGFASRSLLVVCGLAGVILGGFWVFGPGMSFSAQEGGPLVHVVARSSFVHEITERGEVESASNVEIRCEVRAKGAAGTTILEIVPEGTYAEQGDVLVRLDSSSLESDRTKQKIVVNSSEAAVIKSRNTHETALIAKQEYVEGQYQQEVQNILNQKFIAEEDLRRAEEYVNYSQRLAAKGYVTALQLEADQFAVNKAKNQLEIAETKLRVLQEFTRAKMLKQHESDIATSKASYEAQLDSHRLDVEELARIEEQIVKCTLTAPEPGQVVYASQSNPRGGQEVIIAEGESVREGQVIIRLPDPKRMQVKAKINEARISQVAETMETFIRLDALPDRELTGVVTKVNEYPEPSAWHAANVKEYGTIIRIDGSPPGLRPGLTAEVRILIERLQNVLQLPVQAVFEHGGKHYCIVPTRAGLEARELTIGSTNDKTVVIKEGVEEGDQVILNAAANRDKVALPELPPEAERPGGAENRPLRPTNRGGEGDGAAGSPRSGAEQANRSPGAGGAGQRGAGERAPGERAPGGRGEADRASGPGQPPAEGGGGVPNVDAIIDRMFARADANGDGFLEGDEIPERMRGNLADADRNKDGKLDRAEVKAIMSKMGAPRPRNE